MGKRIVYLLFLLLIGIFLCLSCEYTDRPHQTVFEPNHLHLGHGRFIVSPTGPAPVEHGFGYYSRPRHPLSPHRP